MRTRTWKAVGTALLVLSLLFPTPAAWAGGLWMYERGTPEVGTANAGVAARAEDASIALSNPAGMTRLDRPSVLFGLQPIIMDVQFKPNSATNTGGPDGNGDGVMPTASAFYVQPLGKDWRLGLSLGSYFGLGVDYSNDWVGRYFVQKSALITANFTPTIAYRVTDWLSVGAGLTVQFAHMKSTAAINNIGQSDGQLEYKDNSVGIGGGAGILLEPREGTRFGLTYVSPIRQTFEDTPTFSNLQPGTQAIFNAAGILDAKVKIKMTIPQAVMFSAYHRFNDQWAVMGNLGWQNWTKFGYVPISITSTTSPSTVVNNQYNDTFHVAVGAHYRFHPAWTATAGFAFDTSPVSDGNRTIALPLDRQLRYSAGLIYDLTKHVTLGLGYTFMDGGSASVNQTRSPVNTVSGDYSSNYYHIIALSAAARF